MTWTHLPGDVRIYAGAVTHTLYITFPQTAERLKNEIVGMAKTAADLYTVVFDEQQAGWQDKRYTLVINMVKLAWYARTAKADEGLVRRDSDALLGKILERVKEAA